MPSTASTGSRPVPPSATEGEANRRPPAIVAWAVLAIEVSWLAALVALAIWTSNPVTLNREQVLRALRQGVVVRARVVDVTTGRCETLEQWPTDTVAGSFDAVNLEHTEARAGESYLLPLMESGDSILVVPTPAGQPLIYPDSEEALAQLDELLRE